MIPRFLVSPCCSFVSRLTLGGAALLGVLGAALYAESQSNAKPPAANAALDYFGAKLPGENAEIFAPGVVSRPDRFEARIAFSPDLTECYLTETDATFAHPRLLSARRGKDGWTDFSPAAFASRFKVSHEPFVAADNQKLYFTADGDAAVPGNFRDFWVVERTSSGWSEPHRLPPPINSDAAEFFFGQSSDGTIVFASNRPDGLGDFDLYYVENNGNGADRAVNFGPAVNSPGPEYDPCIAKDGKYLVFASVRDGHNNLDLYVSFREGNRWTAPVPLKGNVNTGANEYGPTLSPDGRWLFFVRHDGKQSDLFWMSTAALTPERYARSD